MVKDSDKKPQATIDLGIASLLNEPPKESVLSDKVSVQVASSLSYKELADADKWSELIRVAEGRLDGSGIDSLTARLWWIKAHCKGRSLPLSALLAPLDKAITASSLYIGKDEQFTHLAKSAVQLYWDALTESDDKQLVPVVSEKFSKLLEPEPQSDSLSTITSDVLPPDNSSRPLLVGVSALFLFSCLAVSYFFFSLFSGKSSDTMDAGNYILAAKEVGITSSYTPPELMSPDISLANVSMRDSINSVLDVLAKESPVATEALPAKEVRETRPVVVNTRFPVEPPEVKRAVSRASSSSNDGPKSVRAVIGHKDASRNIFSAEQTPHQHAQPDPKRREPEIVFKPGIYRVARSVAVRSRASRNASVLAGLLVNDRVFVESYYDGWLKIVSTHEKPGYIPLDAVEPSSWAQ